jgi:hypothetical protein
MHVLRIDAITARGPVVRRMLDADEQTQAPRWTEEAFLFPGYQTAELAYAVTKHVAQGRTVAATRSVVTPSDDRQGTYVALTRGSGDNVLMVITTSPKLADPLPLSRPAPELKRFGDLEQQRQGQAARRSSQDDLNEGLAVLADVLARDATDLAATEYRQQQRSNADHLGLLHAIWMDLTAKADAERFRPAVQSALADIWGMTEAGLDSPTARWLYRTMRTAELAGEDPARAVREAVQSRDLAGARDIPAVIGARMRRSVNVLAPRPAGRWADRVPSVADPEMREYLGKLATLMDERRAADAELRRRYPDVRIEPLRSAEPEQVTDEQRADLDVLPDGQREYQPPPWMQELAEARKAFSEKIAERHSNMEPDEDPDYEDVGPAFPAWQPPDREAVLQPPKPPIPPSGRLAERQAEAGEREL